MCARVAALACALAAATGCLPPEPRSAPVPDTGRPVRAQALATLARVEAAERLSQRAGRRRGLVRGASRRAGDAAAGMLCTPISA